MSDARSIKDGPWTWQSKAVRRKIREAFDATNNVASALAVYDALTEIGSDKGAETFTTTHAWIARMSGASIRTVQNHVKVFAELDLVAVSTPQLRAPSTYTLLPFSSDCATLSNQCTTFGNGRNFLGLPTSEENQKNVLEEKVKKATRSLPSLAEWIKEAQAKHADWPKADAESAFEYYESVGWKRGKAPIVKWQACISTCYRNWQSRDHSRRPSQTPARQLTEIYPDPDDKPLFET